MSDINQFSGRLIISPNPDASKQLGADYFQVMQSFRFFLAPIGIANEWTCYDTNRWVFVPAGFLSDGYTIPRAFWSYISPINEYAQAAVLHDYLCEYLSITVDGQPQAISRADCDLIFRDAMLSLGMDKEDVTLVYDAVSAYRILDNVTAPSSTALKRSLESKFNYPGLS